jgi:hypothetical protein
MQIKFILALTSLAVILVSHAGNSTASPPMKQADRATIAHFGKNDFFTAGCEFSDIGDLKDKKEGDVFYYEISKVHPGQATFSELNTEEKVAKIKKAHKAYAKKHGGQSPDYDDGHAVYPLDKEKAFPVANTPWGLILINGHHRTIASKRLDATTIPVIIIRDQRDLKVDQLEQLRAKMNPIDVKGQRVKMPCNFDELDDPKNDDPNRYFVKISAYFGGNTKPEGTDYPLWIPLGKYYGHQEFVISLLLNKYNLVYSNQNGDKIPADFIKQARRLLKEHENEIQENDRVCVIKDKTYYTDVLYINNETCPEPYKMGFKSETLKTIYD